MATAQLTPVEVGIHNVLIATDFSRYSKMALDFGLQLAHRDHLNAYVVFVVPRDEFLLAGPGAYVAATEASRRDLLELKEELRLRHAYVEGKDYRLFMLDGEIAQSILNFAHQKQIDLIVVGTHGRSGLSKVLMGSVAEKVFRQSPVPVLTVGPQLHRFSLGLAPRNILLAADFTPVSRNAAHYAFLLAAQNDAQLTLLHVLDPSALKGIGDPELVKLEMQKKLKELIGDSDRRVRSCFRVEAGHVVPTILEVATQIEADLLILGVRPWNRMLDRLIWPHAYQIVREAPCPVLTVRR